MIPEARNCARQIVQGSAQVSRHLVRSMSRKVHLLPTAPALDLHPDAAVFAGDNGGSVHEYCKILHTTIPLKTERKLYPVGATKRVRKVKHICCQLLGRDAPKLFATQLLTKRDGSMWGKPKLLNIAPAIETNADDIAVTGNNRRGTDEFTGHTNVLLWPLDRKTIAHRDNPRGGLCVSQPKVCITEFLRNSLFELAGLEFHLIGHANKFRRVNTQAGSTLNSLVSFRAAFPRRHLNHSHKSASYSQGQASALGGGVTPEASGNKEGIS